MSIYVRNDDVDTSQEAAQALNPTPAQQAALKFLVDNDRPEGWTAWEIEQALPDRLGMCPWHRVGDLRQLGLATWATDEDGNVIKRPGISGRRQRATRVVR